MPTIIPIDSEDKKGLDPEPPQDHPLSMPRGSRVCLLASFGGCMAQASYFDTARRPVSFLAKKARFVTTSKVRSCHKAVCASVRAAAVRNNSPRADWTG